MTAGRAPAERPPADLLFLVKTHPQVIQRLVEKVAEAGVSSVSQYVADVLAIHVGLPQHVRELNQAPLTRAGARKIQPLRGDRIMIPPTTRFHSGSRGGPPMPGSSRTAGRPTSPTSWRYTWAYPNTSATSRRGGAASAHKRITDRACGLTPDT